MRVAQGIEPRTDQVCKGSQSSPGWPRRSPRGSPTTTRQPGTVAGRGGEPGIERATYRHDGDSELRAPARCFRECVPGHAPSGPALATPTRGASGGPRPFRSCVQRRIPLGVGEYGSGHASSGLAQNAPLGKSVPGGPCPVPEVHVCQTTPLPAVPNLSRLFRSVSLATPTGALASGWA